MSQISKCWFSFKMSILGPMVSFLVDLGMGVSGSITDLCKHKKFRVLMWNKKSERNHQTSVHSECLSGADAPAMNCNLLQGVFSVFLIFACQFMQLKTLSDTIKSHENHQDWKRPLRSSRPAVVPLLVP